MVAGGLGEEVVELAGGADDDGGLLPLQPLVLGRRARPRHHQPVAGAPPAGGQNARKT